MTQGTRTRPERFRVVSVLDDELTADMAERLAYAGTRDYDAIAHKIRPGGKPVTYHVREVPHGLWEDFVDASDAWSEKYKRAFMCGVEKVEHLPMRDGVQLGTWAPSTLNQRSGSIILSDEDLRLFSPAERAEIGSVIYTHSFLPRRIAATYLLPLSLHEPMQSMALRFAELSLSAAEATSSAARSAVSTTNQDTTAPAPSMGGSGSGSRTAVSAAAAINF